MAQSVTKVTNLKSQIQSKAQEAVTSLQQKTASSTKATQAGSTQTPKITETPKVTILRKAQPTATTQVDVTPITVTPAVSKVTPTNLLGNTNLRKAETPNLLDGETNTTGIAGAINKWLYEKPQQITQKFTETDLFDKSKNVIIDTARFGISTVQGWLERYGDSPIVGLPKSVQEGNVGTNIKEQRNEILKSAFDKLESRDQGLSKDKGYKEAKERAEEWSASGKSMRQALQEGNWDVYLTRGGEVLGQIIPALATSIITKNPKAVAGTVFTTVYGDAYKRNLTDVVKDPDFKDLTGQQKTDLASLLATTEAVIETIGDMLELAPFMKGKTSFSRMLGIKNALASFIVNRQGTAATEGLEEVSTEVLQTFIKQAYGSLDKTSREELWRIFSDTHALMQFAGLPGGAGGVIETHNRNKEREELSREADKYDNFNDFESAAERGGVEDKELIQDAWSQSKGLSSEQTTALKYDVEYVEDLEDETTQLYEEKETTEKNLEELRTNPEENKDQISKLETRLQEIDNRIEEIDKDLKEYNEYYTEKTEEELPESQKQQIPSEEGGENLSEQTMRDVPLSNIEVSQRIQHWDRKLMRLDFKRSMNQINKGKSYSDTPFARYAYMSSGTYMPGENGQRQIMINKVNELLDGIGIDLAFTNEGDVVLGKGVVGKYQPKDQAVIYRRDYNEMTTYGHEVFHAMMDVIMNGTLTDKKLQARLQSELTQALIDVKKEMGIDGFSGEEGRYARIYAEEWLANAFGEYLANRELTGPKTFKQKIIKFFDSIIGAIHGIFKKDKSISKELEHAFKKIAEGKVQGHLTPGEIHLIDIQKNNISKSPIESSTEFTQEELKDMDGYSESQEENKLQSEQQNELGEHGEEIMEAGKESDFENEIYNDSMNVEESEDVLSGRASITPQVVKDAFGKDKKKRFKALSIMKTEVLQGAKDILTPAKTRIFNISPRIGGRLIQMEIQRDVYTHRYRERAKPFVEAISKLDDKAKLEIKKALLDYGALAFEQGENIEQYKQEEVAKLKEVLNKYGVSEEATNDMFAMLAELGQRYKDAGLSITLSDIYFPRTVTDYEGLQEYISNVTGIPQEEKATLLKRIQNITIDDKLTEEEKEKKIRHWMTTDYHEPGKTSKNAKERKMGLLSEWGEGIYQFYGDPIEALDSYIVTMEDAIQKQLFLGGLQEDAGLKGENVSLEEIIMGLVREGKISNEDLEELKKSISSVLNKKPTPKIVKTAKSIVHIGLLANFISAITQFDDLGVIILKDRKGLINVCKTIFGKAGIKYTDLGLENSYEMFKDQLNITNWFFAKSLFNWVDRLGKTSFINTAWDSLKRQAKKTKDGKDTITRVNLIKRLIDMYGEETANHIMEKIDSDNYMTNGQIDIDVLTDLLYLLSETQPLYTSDMPTSYLNNGWVRLCYSLQSFTIKRMNMLIQGTKQVYKNNGGGAVGAGKAAVWLMYTTVFLAIRGAMIGDAQDFLKGDKDETTLYKFITEGIDKALDQLWKDSKGSWLKIWNLSDYDKKIYDRQGAWGWLMSKFEPPIIGMGADLLEAITEHNKDEITDIAKYTPIIGKLLYYWFWDELGKETKGKNDEWNWGGEKKYDWGDDNKYDWGEKKEYNR